MEAAQRVLGKPMPELQYEPIAPEAQYLWSWFAELSNARGNSGFGPSPITYLEIQAWAALKQISIEVFEVNALKALDSVYLNSSNKEKKTP